MRTLDELYTDCQKTNRLFYNDLYEAFINRNQAEIKEIANLAIGKNVDFVADYLDRPDVSDLAKKLLSLAMAIEALERAFSNVDIKFAASIADQPRVRATTAAIEAANALPAAKRHAVMKRRLRELRIELKREIFKRATRRLLESDDAANSALRAICKYYLVFRALRELRSTFYSHDRGRQIIEKQEILKRAQKYSQMALAIDPNKIEIYFVQAMLHRELGNFDRDPQELWRAWLILVEAYVQIDTVLQRILSAGYSRVSDEDRAATCVDIALFKPRLINDIARVYEHLAACKCPAVTVNITKGVGLGAKRISPRVLWRRLAAMGQDAGKAESRQVHSRFDQEIGALLADDLLVFSSQVAESHTYFARARRLLARLEEYDRGDRDYFQIFGPPARSELERHDARGEAIHPAAVYALKNLHKNPRAHVYLHNIGRMFIRSDQETSAIKYYKAALEHNPDYTAARENLALLLMSNGDCASADRHLRIARRLFAEKSNPRRSELQPNLAEVIMAEREQQKLLKKYLVQEPTLDPSKHDHLAILRRWNSYTPSIPTKPKSPGGGYFLSVAGQGIVIDPGFDFLRNFAEAGYAINDIKCIIVTHLHADHVKDLEDMLFLFYEQYKRTGLTAKTVYICAMHKVLRGLAHRLCAFGGAKIFSNIRFVRLEPAGGTAAARVSQLTENMANPLAYERPWAATDLEGVTIETTPTFHFGKTPATSTTADKNGCGLLIKLTKNNTTIGYTSDTCWHEAMAAAYKDCDLLIAHLGELYCDDIDRTGRITKNPKLEARRHLGLYGLYSLICRCADRGLKLAVVSEFGEELGAYRNQVAKQLNDALFFAKQKTFCLTGDLSLRISLPKRGLKFDVHCEMCGSYFYRPFEEISEIAVPLSNGDSRVVYFCHRHHKSIVREKLGLSATER